MAVYVNNKYRINRSIEYEADMKYLGKDGLKIFNSYAQILVVSAIIGYQNKAYVPVINQAESVLMQFFQDRELDIMDLIAYAHVGDQSILRNKTDEKYTIFEAYANGGFPILCKKLGVDLIDKEKNDRHVILQNYYSMLLSNNIIL